MQLAIYSLGIFGLAAGLVVFSYLNHVYRELGRVTTGRVHQNLDVFEAEIEPRIPFLTIKPKGTLPRDSRVTIDGKEVEGLGVALPVNPGTRTIAVLAPKHTVEKFVVEVAEAEQVELLVTAGKVIVEPTRPVAAVLGPRRIAGFAALGVGALGFVGAIITGGIIVSADGRVEEGCPRVKCDTAAGHEAHLDVAGGEARGADVQGGEADAPAAERAGGVVHSGSGQDLARS